MCSVDIAPNATSRHLIDETHYRKSKVESSGQRTQGWKTGRKRHCQNADRSNVVFIVFNLNIFR